MVTTDDYVGLVTGQHQDKPKFRQVIEALTRGFAEINNTQEAYIDLFDLDQAVGQQLDIVGAWIGVSRYLTVPITGVYFTWDDTALTGWDSGSWRGEFDPVTGLTSLPDDAYRNLLKARAVANQWDGSMPEAAAIWAAAFPGQTVIIQDNQDMSMILGFVGAPISAIQQALLTGGYLPLKPAGVRVSYYAIPVNDGPLFAWDIDNAFLAGWDEGSWAQLLT
jgi:hypothetical protein